MRPTHGLVLAVLLLATFIAGKTTADVPLEGFVPLVGMGLTDEFEPYVEDSNSTFWISQPSETIGGQPLGNSGGAHYEVALFDTGTATHILTHDSYGPDGFDIVGNGFEGSTVQCISCHSFLQPLISDPLGVYAGGLRYGDTSSGELIMEPNQLRGQISFATLAPRSDETWEIPNIIGMPMAAAYSVHIKNSEPVIKPLGNETLRTPQIDFHPIGAGGQGIGRHAALKLKPEEEFATGPLYFFDVANVLEGIPLHENPATPSVINSGGIFVDVNMTLGNAISSDEFLLDTGSTTTVISTYKAIELGIDLDQTPDFTFSVEGSGGVTAGIPGFVVDALSLNTADGSFELSNVPVMVLDVANPNDPGNIIPGILGMNVFADRDIVIDANPSLDGIGAPPALYISDPVTVACNWTDTQATGNWLTPNHWSGDSTPNGSCDARVANVTGNHQEAVIGAGLASTIYQATISGSNTADMVVVVKPGGGLLVYSDLVVEGAGTLHLESDETSTAKINAQHIVLDEGSLTGSGDIWVGSGPLAGSLRNNNGLIAPGDADADPIGFFTIGGDVSNQANMSFDIGGTAGGQFDTISIGRNAYLEGTLNIDLIDGFRPAVGDEFQIITVGDQVVGQFDNVLLPTGYIWDLSYTPLGVNVEVTGISELYCDSDGDGDCDHADLDAMYAAFGSRGQFDYDNSGTVDEADIQGWLDAASDPFNPAKLSSSDQFFIGDVNFDGKVSSQDLGLLLNNFGNGDGLGWGAGDLNGDAAVNSDDLGLLLNNFGRESSAAATVPEPSAMSLLLVGIAFIVGRRRTRE